MAVLAESWFTMAPFTELGTLKGEQTWGQMASSILGKLNLRSVRVKQAGMPRSLGGVCNCRARLGFPGCFYQGPLGSQAGFRHLFTSLFLPARLELLVARVGPG